MNLVNFLIWIILGIPLFFTYSTIDNSFWVGIDSTKHFYRFYIACIIFAFIAGTSMVAWSSMYELEDENESELVTLGIVLLVGFSILWVPMFKQSQTNRNYRWATVLALFGAAVGAMILAHTVLYPIIYDNPKSDKYSEDSNKYSSWWSFPALYLVFQTAIMDLIIWNYYYLNSR